jgi:hypothetical protein
MKKLEIKGTAICKHKPMKFIVKAAKEISLEEFVKGNHKRLDKFKQYWLSENKKDPEQFPLVMPGNSGLWFEMFDDFWPQGGL